MEQRLYAKDLKECVSKWLWLVFCNVSAFTPGKMRYFVTLCLADITAKNLSCCCCSCFRFFFFSFFLMSSSSLLFFISWCSYYIRFRTGAIYLLPKSSTLNLELKNTPSQLIEDYSIRAKATRP